MFKVSIDEPHGAVVRWEKDPNQDKLFGSKQAVVKCQYQNTFSVDLAKAGKYDLKRRRKISVGLRTTTDLSSF